MSERNPDYEDLRARQARSQRDHVTVPTRTDNDERNDDA